MQVDLSNNEYFITVSIFDTVLRAYHKGNKRAMISLPDEVQQHIASVLRKLRNERDKRIGYTHAS